MGLPIEGCRWPAFHLAYKLLDALLRGGWVEVEERRESGNWRPIWISFLESSALRRHLGLADKEALAKMYRAEAMRPATGCASGKRAPQPDGCISPARTTQVGVTACP